MRERLNDHVCKRKRERERMPPNTHIISTQPMGDSYQNAARTILKGYGNYGKHTHTYTHIHSQEGRPSTRLI